MTKLPVSGGVFGRGLAIAIVVAALLGVEDSMLGDNAVLVEVGRLLAVVGVWRVVVRRLTVSGGHALLARAAAAAAAATAVLGAVDIVDRDVLLVLDEVPRLSRMLVFVVVGCRVSCVDLFVAVATSEKRGTVFELLVWICAEFLCQPWYTTVNLR